MVWLIFLHLVFSGLSHSSHTGPLSASRVTQACFCPRPLSWLWPLPLFLNGQVLMSSSSQLKCHLGKAFPHLLSITKSHEFLLQHFSFCFLYLVFCCLDHLPPHLGSGAIVTLHPQGPVCRWALGRCSMSTCRVEDAIRATDQQQGPRGSGSDPREC